MNVRTVVPLLWPSEATLVMPGSKSEANRVLVAAALSGREVTVTGASPSDDVRHLVCGLATLGFAAGFLDEANGVVQVGPRRGNAPSSGELFCGNAGTTLRFLVSLAAITPGEWTITGDAAMQRRPIEALTAAWRQLGVAVQATNGCPPVRVRCTAVPAGGRVQIDAGVSSQFVSSLLLVGCAMPGGIDVEYAGKLASKAYVQLTCRVLAGFGVTASSDDRGARVAPGCHNPPATVSVGGDWSSAGVWACLQHLTGSRIEARNLHRDSNQADERLGDVLQAMPAAGDHTIDVAGMPDQFLNLTIVAAHRQGTTRLVGGRNLRIKESDRIAVMARELTKVGVDVDERPDGLVVHGGRPLRPATIDPESDHRVAMAFALAALLSPGITIGNPACVTKSYPDFWRDLDAVTAVRRCVAVVGMRGAGKSTFAKALACRSGAEWVDTDQRFVVQHEPIGVFVARHGWPQFRQHEENLVEQSLRPGRIVSTGGGVIERLANRTMLQTRALVVWLDGDVALLRSRLAADTEARPSLTGAPVLDELPALLARRNPLYEQVAHVRIDAALPTGRQVDLALQALGTRCRWPSSDTASASP